MLAGDPPDPRRDDPLTRRVLDYRRTLRGGPCPPACPAPRFRLLHRAHRAYEQNGEARWELEARLLAGQPVRVVARRVGLSRGLVALYHDVFAACRDRLAATDWVRWAFVGPGPSVGFAPGDLGGVWRWVGYFGGPHALDLVAAATSAHARRHAYPADALASARRFVLAAQVPVTARFTALAAVAGMAAEDERRREPAGAAIGPGWMAGALDVAAPVGAASPVATPSGPQRVGKSRPCGATAA